MANRYEIMDKIQARRIEKQAAATAKFAKMRQVADSDPSQIEQDLTNLAEACAAQAEAYDNLKENLDLIQPPKEAPLSAKVTAARNYAKAFKRIADEAPEQLAAAVSEAYHSLDEQAGALEMLSDHLGIDLNSTPVEDAFAQEGIEEIGEAEEAGVPITSEIEDESEDGETQSEEKEAGSEGFVTDRALSGKPTNPKKVDVPRVAGIGSDAFVTDRDKDSKPFDPKKMESKVAFRTGRPRP
jgi:hypothetical protein